MLFDLQVQHEQHPTHPMLLQLLKARHHKFDTTKQTVNDWLMKFNPSIPICPRKHIVKSRFHLVRSRTSGSCLKEINELFPKTFRSMEINLFVEYDVPNQILSHVYHDFLSVLWFSAGIQFLFEWDRRVESTHTTVGFGNDESSLIIISFSFFDFSSRCRWSFSWKNQQLFDFLLVLFGEIYLSLFGCFFLAFFFFKLCLQFLWLSFRQ